MKFNPLVIFFVLASLAVVHVSCTVTGKETIVDNSYTEEEGIHGQDINTSLAAALRKNSGSSIQIMGTEPNIDVIIRGMNTIVGDPRALFVVDGIRMGRNYTLAANAVDVRRIKSIRVIKSLSQLALYGEDGRNGVIEIKHQKDN